LQEQDEHGLSTHEKELLKKRAEIEKMEKGVLEPSTWTMQGEVMNSIHFILFETI
jgi:U3 small nucleolar RNA-associated protein MPP10